VHLFINLLFRKFTAIVHLRTINQLVFAMETPPVYHGVGTKLSYVIYMNKSYLDKGRAAEAWESPNRCYPLAEIGGWGEGLKKRVPQLYFIFRSSELTLFL